ncbi:peroxisomal membrane anchor domain-containing protein, variant 1 [Xylariales sp. AK1849]|nr:peroxisomal membrane anchor domain-containing protein, variant 1 [Xylariales sp. AK1849]
MAGSDEPDAPSDTQPLNTESESESTLEQARRFLGDGTVRSSSRQKKEDFLKTKGLNDDDIQKLLGEESQPQLEPNAKAETVPELTPAVNQGPQDSIKQTTSSPVKASSSSDTPPIITYPEFLTRPQRPPPLLTPRRLLNILTIAGTGWTLLYGVARFVVSPMVQARDEARSDYYRHVNTKLSTLVEKLEGMVSVVPYKNGKPLKSELHSADDSSYDDPTELFHRDIGTQTSQETTPALASKPEEKAFDKQMRQLIHMSSMLREYSEKTTRRTEKIADIRSEIREFNDELDKMAHPPMPEYSGIGSSPEPEDEFTKVKKEIRSVKGMLLSAKMFPAATPR